MLLETSELRFVRSSIMNELQQRFFEHLAGIQELEIFYKNYWSVY